VFVSLIAIVHFTFNRRNNEFLYLHIAVLTAREERDLPPPSRRAAVAPDDEVTRSVAAK